MNDDDFYFDGSMTRETLKAYLKRAVTLNGAAGSPDWNDDIRMVLECGAMFLGRAAYVWVMPENDEKQFALAEAFAERVHEADSRIILQAGIFEAIYPEIDLIPVPGWVFEAFGDEAEERCFRFEATHDPQRRTEYAWEFGTGGTCPDITKRESQYWFYYRARRYIDAGYEAIHLGQPHMYADRDRGYSVFADLCTRIRAYARQAARRHLVILDAHTHGILVDDGQLFDFHSRPLSAINWLSRPEKIILQMKGRSMGGRSPLGWECDTIPYLYEVDNWGGYSVDPQDWHTTRARESARRWGWDDINWFAHQEREDRHEFLRYAALWCRVEDADLYFQPVLRRLLGEAGIVARNDGTPDVRASHGDSDSKADRKPSIWHYRANRSTERRPEGFADERVVQEILGADDPAWLSDYHQRVRAYGEGLTPEVPGVRRSTPGPVVIVGSAQEIFGGTPGENYDPFSRLYQTGDWIHERAVVLPGAGRWTFAVGVGGTGTDYHHRGGLHFGPEYEIASEHPHVIARFRFDVRERSLSVTDSDGNSLLSE
ncbi:MAG: hypothetical protein ACLFNQ_09865 [Spirochaetaceae bacterium]